MDNKKKPVLGDPSWNYSKHKSLILYLAIALIIIVWAVKIANEVKTMDIPDIPDTSFPASVVDAQKIQEKDELGTGTIPCEEHSDELVSLTAETDKWSEPIMIARGQWFDFDWECSGDAEDGKMKMLVTAGKGSKEYIGNCKDWIELDSDLEAPTSLKFRAEELPTKVWVNIYSKY